MVSLTPSQVVQVRKAFGLPVAGPPSLGEVSPTYQQIVEDAIHRQYEPAAVGAITSALGEIAQIDAQISLLMNTLGINEIGEGSLSFSPAGIAAAYNMRARLVRQLASMLGVPSPGGGGFRFYSYQY